MNNTIKNNTEEALAFFLQALKNGERDVYKLMETPEDFFEEIPFEDLFAHEDDMLHGLNRMQRYFGGFYFDLFDKLMVKHYDNGEIKFGFYVQTTDADEVISFSKLLLDHFHDEITKYRQQPSFCDHEKIINFSEGLTPDDTENIFELWNAHDASFVLMYINSPQNVFGFSISIEAKKIVDRSVRRNGTILNSLDFDIDLLLAIGDQLLPEEIHPDDEQIVDYTYSLAKKQLGLFDTIKIRLFNRRREFRQDVRTHIFLTSSEPVDFDNIELLIRKLHNLYGTDNNGAAETEYAERETYEMLGICFGRRWTFNKAHAILDENNENEELAYEVQVNNLNNQGELTLKIICYNELLALFG